LSALQIDPDTGRYISEHEADDEIALCQRVYGPELPRFVAECMRTGDQEVSAPRDQSADAREERQGSLVNKPGSDQHTSSSR
jgi:hypothetical protein